MISDGLAQVLRETLEMQIAGENGDEESAGQYEAKRNAGEKALSSGEVDVAQMFAGDTADAFQLLRGDATLEQLMTKTRAERLAEQTAWLKTVTSLAGKPPLQE